ncbi:hypothetical protein [Aureibacillus halotolerans]|uniref:Flagellar hook-length control protein FliK n=1 Tax=Aureibacillus halotolerans TaxID=1508390 RepID=A0A4R6U7B1_9BACI|nr:hypothetical protein [Aureibacillus halotolerans]TDQ42408.1 hypothetical protein EV213_102442 [Aureibacillus halotolerans]
MIQQLMDMLSTTMQRPQQPLTVTEGQLIRGKILEIKPESQTAVVLLAGKRVEASLNASLQTGRSYVFEVFQNQKEGPPIGLRPVPVAPQQPSASKATVPSVPSWLADALKGGQTIQRNELGDWQKLFRQWSQRPEGTAILQTMVRFSMPPTERNFLSLQQLVQSPQLATTQQSAQQLLNALAPFQQPNDVQLKQALSLLLQDNRSGAPLKERVAVLQGWANATIPQKEAGSQTLQHLLQQASVDHGQSSVGKDAQELHQKLQLLSHFSRERDGIGQTFLLHFSDEFGDQYIQYQGQKNESGELDTTFCRLFMCLTLDPLGEVVIDARVQNRLVSVDVTHQEKELSPLLKASESILREKLADLDYSLSYIEQTSRQTDKAAEDWFFGLRPPSKEGVDWKI